MILWVYYVPCGGWLGGRPVQNELGFPVIEKQKYTNNGKNNNNDDDDDNNNNNSSNNHHNDNNNDNSNYNDKIMKMVILNNDNKKIIDNYTFLCPYLISTHFLHLPP